MTGSRTRLFHRTTAVSARVILRSGFTDATGKYLTDTEHTGVWLSDRPLDEAAEFDTLLVVEIAGELVEPYEWVEEGKPYREFLVPAAVLNAAATVAVVDEPVISEPDTKLIIAALSGEDVGSFRCCGCDRIEELGLWSERPPCRWCGATAWQYVSS